MTKEVVCIVCPSSCRLLVHDDNGEMKVSGNTCNRGIEHGISEYTQPMRMLTSTVLIENGILPRLSVISTKEVPKAKLKECLAQIYDLAVQAPIACGDVIIHDICYTGADLVASRTMKKKEIY